MSEEAEHRCFIGGLSYSTTDRSLKDAFKKFGELLDAKVSVDKFSGRARGFGFITFKEKRDMEDAIKAMNGVDLDGRDITVEKAQAQGSGRDRGGDRPRDNRDRDYGRDRDRGRGSGGGDCFKCGKPGHFARECPDGEGGGGGRYGSRDGGGGGRYSGRDDRDGGGGGGRDRDRSGERYGGRSRDSDRDGGGGGGGGGGGDRYSRGDRSGPYDRRGSGRDKS